MLKRFIVALIVLCVGSVQAAAEDTSAENEEIHTIVLDDADGRQILQHIAIIEAPISSVWEVFTTEDGFRLWATPNVHMDFGVGGIIETSYGAEFRVGDPSNIKNQIVAYIPERLLVLRSVQAPPGFAPQEVRGVQLVNHIIRQNPDRLPGYREIRVDVLTPEAELGGTLDFERAHLDRLIRMGEVEAERWVAG